jgi:murein DD-endopeptidase MepM/ murein hydrolase activator NlpD
MKKTITALACLAVLGAGAVVAVAADPPARLLTFYPQAGTIGQDLYVTNFVDLEEGPGVRDYACGGQTYDGHTGIDSMIRSFREVRIGVPVFAALDGRVLSVQQGVGGDFNWGRTVSNFDNHVILDHGGDQQSVYGHLAWKSITVKKGQWVAAGTEIGRTASSGNSSWPHLHFTVRQSFAPYEPFAGECGTTAGWATQPAVPAESWVADVALSAEAFAGKADLPYDEAVRTGTFVRGLRFVNVRVEVRNLAVAGPGKLTIRRPNGTVAYAGALSASGSRAGWAKRRLRISLAQLGRWSLTYELGGTVAANAPFDVVATPKRIVNRAPNAVSASLEPASPRAGEVVVCRVATSLVTEDPDFEIVRYRYRWTSGGRLVRQVTSAALSDALRNNAARPGESLSCEVTPSDGRLRGPSASAGARLPG